MDSSERLLPGFFRITEIREDGIVLDRDKKIGISGINLIHKCKKTPFYEVQMSDLVGETIFDPEGNSFLVLAKLGNAIVFMNPEIATLTAEELVNSRYFGKRRLPLCNIEKI